MKQTIAAEIDDTYIPKAVSVGILEAFHENDSSIHVSRLAFASQVVIPIVSFLFLVACWIYYWEVSHTSLSLRKKLTRGSGEDMVLWGGSQRDSVDVTILSMVIGSATFCLYVIALDITAMHNALYTVDADVKKYYNFDTGITNFSLEYFIVFLIFIEDSIVVLVMFVFFWIIVCTSICYHYCCSDAFKYSWSAFVYLTIGPVMCVIIHGNHIIIGFIHSPYHAGSVLIFYGIVILAIVYFYQAFHGTFKCFIAKIRCCEQKQLSDVCFFLLFAIISIIVSGLLVFIVAFFLLVPIDNAIDDAPSQLFSIERTVVVVLAIIVTCKVYSRKPETLLSSVVKAKDKETLHGGESGDRSWVKLEEEEKYVRIGKLFLDKLKKTVV